MGVYMVIGFFSFVTWIVGTILFQLAYFCATTARGLYSFTFFLIVIYWMSFGITVSYLLKMFFGAKISRLVKDSTREISVDEAEANVFTAKFKGYDEKCEQMRSEDFRPFLKDLGIFVPPEEEEALIASFDPDETEMLQYPLMLDWFRFVVIFRL
jgi:hypothetical protein